MTTLFFKNVAGIFRSSVTNVQFCTSDYTKRRMTGTSSLYTGQTRFLRGRNLRYRLERVRRPTNPTGGDQQQYTSCQPTAMAAGGGEVRQYKASRGQGVVLIHSLEHKEQGKDFVLHLLPETTLSGGSLGDRRRLAGIAAVGIAAAGIGSTKQGKEKRGSLQLMFLDLKLKHNRLEQHPRTTLTRWFYCGDGVGSGSQGLPASMVPSGQKKRRERERKERPEGTYPTIRYTRLQQAIPLITTVACHSPADLLRLAAHSVSLTTLYR